MAAIAKVSVSVLVEGLGVLVGAPSAIRDSPSSVARSISTTLFSSRRQTYVASSIGAGTSSASSASSSNRTTCRAAAIGKFGGRISLSSRIAADASSERAVLESLFVCRSWQSSCKQAR
jgi:hypothetical protein